MKNKRRCWIDIEKQECYIELSNGKIAVCDADKWAEVSKFNWSVTSNGYPSTTRNNKTIRLHKFLFPVHKETDHINGNKLDNRSCNLRECSPSLNKANCGLRSDNTSGFKGVSFWPKRNKWIAQISYNKKHFIIGRFSNKEDAAKAYDKRALELFGEYAKTNFVNAKRKADGREGR